MEVKNMVRVLGQFFLVDCTVKEMKHHYLTVTLTLQL